MFYPILSIYNLIYLLYFDNEPFIKNINKVFPENIEFEKNYFIKYKNELNFIYNKFANVDCIKKIIQHLQLARIKKNVGELFI